MSKPKKNIKSALSASLEAESNAFKDKFERADAYFNNKTLTDRSVDEVIEPKKAKVIRDSFTFPEEDYKLIKNLRDRCLKNATMANKSEILRAGLITLTNLTDEELVEAIASLPKVKTGRPNKK